MAKMALKIASKNCQFANVEWADLNSLPNQEGFGAISANFFTKFALEQPV